MNTETYEIRGRQFRTKADYARGYRDNQTIERIEREVDMLDLEAVEELLADLKRGKYHFDTLIGDDYIEEIGELADKLRVEAQAEVESSKKRKGHIKSKTDKSGATGSVSSRKRSKKFTDYDDDMQQEIIKVLKRDQLKRRVMMLILALCILGSVGYLVFYFTLYEKNDMEYTELAELKKEDVGGTVEINYEEAKDKPPVLKKYETLYQKNRRLVGWLSIPGCDIDYPVMQTSNNEYYLDHNYNQDYDKNGSLFMDKDCTPAFPNDNMIIYGHHMKSGKMFGNLNRYAKQDFWEKNPNFNFDTIYETGTYAVMYVFRSRIYAQDEIVFKYYQFIDASSADEFDSNMDAMADMSLYDTGVTAVYGDRLITLSTCDSSEDAGRFVVVAKKIS
ncbi:MAG: class B sortase [Lachnospiraceae bacterium]|nr:class B sortase [Lachnospiraceae bacterium]